MANTLSKNTRVSYIAGTDGTPATPFVPATPARTVYEVRRVCGFVPLRTDDGRYIFSSDPNTGDTTATWVPNTLGSTGGLAGSWQCWMATIPVHYPATPARPATAGVLARPSQVLQNFNLGWNAGGRSKAIFTGDGKVEFQGRVGMVGAIAGMNLSNDVAGPTYSGRNIDFAFYLSHGVARIMESGVDKGFAGTYTETTVFTVQRTDGLVEYLMDGATVYTSLIDDTEAPGWLEVSLYSGGDEIFNPAVSQISAPDLTAGTGEAEVVLPSLALLAADAAFAEATVILPALAVDAGTEIVIPNYGLATVVLPLLSPNGTMLTGEIGSAEVTLPALQALLADHAYGEATVVLPALSFSASTDEPGRINMRVEFLLDIPLIIDKVDRVDVRDAFVLDVPLTVDRVEVVHAEDTFILDVPMSLTVIETLDVRDAFYLDVVTGLPGADLEVHAVAMDGFGSTVYANYPFNSFARIGDNYYGAKLDGLFLLGGNSDAGAPIQAAICPGELDFGSSQEKTIAEVFIGAASEGRLALKVAAECGEFLYEAESHSEHLKQHRFKLGKGLKANYLTPVLYNQNGEDFEIDSLEFSVATLSRKT